MKTIYIAEKLQNLSQYLTQDLAGGPKIWKLSWVINFQKAGSFVFLGFLLWYYQNQSIAAWIYVALQGSYGLVWILKDMSFPDPAWQKKVTIAGGLMAFFGVLMWYWVIAWLLISGTAEAVYPLAEPLWLCFCVSLCILGSVIMMVADAQKYYTLKLQKGLIKEGVYKKIRHPNYLGEMMIYASFALLVCHWIPWLILALVWSMVFLPNMIMKEKSMSRHKDWAAYKKQSGWILPFL